MVKPYTFIR